MVVKQATDEPFYPDVVLFPIYLDHPVSLKKIFHSIWHTNHSLHIGLVYQCHLQITTLVQKKYHIRDYKLDHHNTLLCTAHDIWHNDVC